MGLEIFNPNNYYFSPFALPVFLVGLSIFLLGLFTVIWERGARVSVVFFLLSSSASLWLLGYAWAYSVISNEDLAFRIIQFLHLGVVFIPSFIFLFVVMITQRTVPYTPWAWVNFIASAIIYGVGFKDYSFIEGTYKYSWGFYGRYGPLGGGFIFFFILVSLASFTLLWRAYAQDSREHSRRRLRALFWAFGAGYLGCIDFLPTCGVGVYPLGFIGVFLFTLLSAFTVLRYHLLDITPEFAAEQIQQTMQSALFVVDLNGQIRVANRGACELLDYEEKILKTMPIAKIIESPFDVDAAAKGGEEPVIYNHLVMERKGEIRNHPMVWKARKGNLVRVNASVSVLRNQDSQPEGIVYVALDMTEQRRAEEALRANEERLRAFVETASEGIITADSEGRIAAFNPAAEAMFGYSSLEIIGKPLLTLMPERFKEAYLAAFGRFFETQKPSLGGRTVQLAGIKKNGTEFPLDLSISHWTAKGRAFVTAILRDITEKQKNEEIELRQKDVEMKSQFISMVTHELRTPLTAVKMSVEILLRENPGNLKPKQLEWLDMARSNVDRLARLISQVLDFQKLERGRMEYEMEPFDLKALVQEIGKSVQPLLNNKPLQMKIECPDSFPPVFGDRDRLAEVLTNLVGNAIKFTEKGAIIITVVRKEDKAEVCVADTGIGMRENDLPRLFTSFTRFNTGAGKKEGTGLGLSISRKIVQQHGGELWAESQHGKGSQFYFQIPLVRSVPQKPA